MSAGFDRPEVTRSGLQLRLLVFAFSASWLGCNAITACAEPSAQAILQRFYQATGGSAWQHFEECDSVGAFSALNKTGTIRYLEDLRNGGNRGDVEIVALDLKQSYGNGPMQNWHQDRAGDIRLSGPDEPDAVDDRYLTSHAFWRPNFGGATVTVLAPQSHDSVTWDVLQFKVPGGKGFTLLINRKTGLLDRVQGSIEKQFSDYRPVRGLLLPFAEKKPSGSNEITITYRSRSLHPHLDSSAFAIPFRKDYQMPPSGEVTVPAEGGLIFQATINGKGPFGVLFDTGSVNVLSEGFAHRLGLTLDRQEIEFGTSTTSMSHCHKTHVDQLRIGDLVVRDQTFYVIPIPGEDAAVPTFVVGYELLRRFAVKIDYDRQRLTFYDAPRFQYSGPGTAVPIEIEGINLLVQASIGQATGPFVLDTGNEFGFMVFASFTNKNDLVRKLGAHFLGYDGRSFAGPAPEAYLARVDTVGIGRVATPGIIAHLATDPSDAREFSGNIGQSILRRFNEVFDCMRSQIYFETTKDSDQPEVFNRAGLIFDSYGHGLQIMTVLPGAPGALAGLQTGDVITSVNGEEPGDDVDPPAFLEPPGTELHLAIQRGGETREVSLKLKDLL